MYIRRWCARCEKYKEDQLESQIYFYQSAQFEGISEYTYLYLNPSFFICVYVCVCVCPLCFDWLLGVETLPPTKFFFLGGGGEGRG